MASAFGDRAGIIARTPGPRWKVWTENEAEGRAAASTPSTATPQALACAEEHTARLEGFGITGIRVKLFRVNEPLTAITGGPA